MFAEHRTRGPGARGFLRVAVAAVRAGARCRAADFPRRRATLGDGGARRERGVGGAGDVVGGLDRRRARKPMPKRSPTNTRRCSSGVGKSEVSLYGSAYAKAQRWRAAAGAGAGLARSASSGTPAGRDHVRGPSRGSVRNHARLIIGGDGRADGFAFDVQREFFRANIEPWVPLCCNAICKKAVAMYYARVAQFTNDFVAIERDSFSIES